MTENHINSVTGMAQSESLQVGHIQPYDDAFPSTDDDSCTYIF